MLLKIIIEDTLSQLSLLYIYEKISYYFK